MVHPKKKNSQNHSSDNIAGKQSPESIIRAFQNISAFKYGVLVTCFVKRFIMAYI